MSMSHHTVMDTCSTSAEYHSNTIEGSEKHVNLVKTVHYIFVVHMGHYKCFWGMSLPGRADGAGFVTSEIQFLALRPLPDSSSPVCVASCVSSHWSQWVGDPSVSWSYWWEQFHAWLEMRATHSDFCDRLFRVLLHYMSQFSCSFGIKYDIISEGYEMNAQLITGMTEEIISHVEMVTRKIYD